MTVRLYMVLALLLLCIAVISNVIMYYKCYILNDLNDPFVSENIGVYRVNIYYNKYKDPQDGIYKELRECIQPFKEKNFSRYVVTHNKPTNLEYHQIAKIGNYNF